VIREALDRRAYGFSELGKKDRFFARSWVALMSWAKSFLIVAILLASFLATPLTGSTASATGSSFMFAAAGDHGQDVNTNSSLALLVSSGANFYLALGDLSYYKVGAESIWCNTIKSYVGTNFPIELVSGFHDDGLESSRNDGGLIDNFVNCLPDKMASTGVYGKEYYFDYPPASPLARIIMVSPALNFSNGGYYPYNVGSSHYEWLSNLIDGARSSGIPWVIVAMHKPCISAGIYPDCVAGSDLMNLLIQKRVDLVLQAHDHNYQRSKQLTCAFVEQFASSCVANDGSSGTYTQGRGTVFVIAGTFGQEFYPINFTNPNAAYFARMASNNTSGMGHGFVEYSVSADQLKAQTDFSGSFSDSFRIIKPGALQAIIIYFEDNPIFTSLLIAPIFVGITAISLRHLKRRPLGSKEDKMMGSASDAQDKPKNLED
jgi:calcineurin-like phosphoesterase family protein